VLDADDVEVAIELTRAADGAIASEFVGLVWSTALERARDEAAAAFHAGRPSAKGWFVVAPRAELAGLARVVMSSSKRPDWVREWASWRLREGGDAVEVAVRPRAGHSLVVVSSMAQRARSHGSPLATSPPQRTPCWTTTTSHTRAASPRTRLGFSRRSTRRRPTGSSACAPAHAAHLRCSFTKLNMSGIRRGLDTISPSRRGPRCTTAKHERRAPGCFAFTVHAPERLHRCAQSYTVWPILNRGKSDPANVSS
jgi:hypothetical protein